MPTYRYKAVGVTPQEILDNVTPGTTVSVSNTMPSAYQDVTISDANELANLSYYMGFKGYVFSEADPQVSGAKTIQQIQAQRLTSNILNVTPGLGFVDVLSLNVSSKGNSTFGIVADITASVTVGASMRVLINGGQFNNQVLRGLALPLLGSGAGSVTVPLGIAPTPGYTTYTVKLQVAAVGVLAGVNLNVLADPAAAGASLIVFEYA